jgi:hypothetical protein
MGMSLAYVSSDNIMFTLQRSGPATEIDSCKDEKMAVVWIDRTEQAIFSEFLMSRWQKPLTANPALSKWGK